MVRWVRMVRAQHPLGCRGQWVRVLEARIKLCCDVRMLLLWNSCCSGIDHFCLFVMERGVRIASEWISLCPACILVTVVHRSCNGLPFVSLLLCARYASLVHMAMLIQSDLVPTGHTTDVSMRVVSVPGGLSPPGPLLSASAHWEDR